MTVKLGLVGTGTVGGGCIDILKNHREEFKRHFGIDVELARVCSRNPEQAIEHGVEDIFTQDFHDILDDPDIDIVIELIGGTTVARDVVLGALRAGKNVVTANKALMATHGEEVMRTAEEAGKEIAFEASVGGGMIHPKVLEGCGIDSTVYSGWAFGMGLERLALGHFKISDLRLIFENDVRFLEQF